MRKIVAAAAAAALLCTPALAEDRKIDFGQLILDDNDQPIQECERYDPAKPGQCLEIVSATLGMYAAKALNQRFQDEPALALDEQVHRGQLAYWIKRAKLVAITTDSHCPPAATDCLTVADRDLIRKNVAKIGWATLIVWRISTALDGAPAQPAPK